MNKITIILLLAIITISSASDTLGIKPKIVFLTEDVANGYVHRGCTPELMDNLITIFKKEYPDKYVKYDLQKLLNNKIKPYNIFNKKYCKKIGEILNANVFVMSRLVLVGHDEKGECTGDLYNIQIKVYSKILENETTVFSHDSIPAYNFDSLFVGKDKFYIDKIITAGTKLNN